MINFSSTEKFDREKKRLLKKYPSLSDELKELVLKLSKDPMQGASLFKNFRKIRLSISSKGKGKRGSARVITYNCIVAENDGEITFISIYDKNEMDSIPKSELRKIWESEKERLLKPKK